MLHLQPTLGKLNFASTPDDLAGRVAEAFLALVAEHPQDRPFTVALSGGSTPGKVYDQLVGKLKERGVGAAFFDRLAVFWSDERGVLPTDPASNVGLALSRWFEPMGLPLANCVPPRVYLPFSLSPPLEERRSSPPADAATQIAAKAYSDTIAHTFAGALHKAAFDLILLGMGDEGHTASLFPHEPHLNDAVPAVVATLAPEYVAPLPRERISFNLPLINQARRVWVLLTGTAKRDRLAQVWSAPANVQAMPIQGVRPANGELVWWVSQEAMP